MRITTDDYHTGGEPFRIVTGGTAALQGADVLERREWARNNLDDVRLLLVNEPRGHPDMYGCHLVPPNDEGAAFGAVFFHKDGYSLACGHGTIALGTWAVETGRVGSTDEGETPVVIDVPSGRVVARVRRQAGRALATVFRNVAAYVAARQVEVTTSAGSVPVDVAWGGAAYASLPAAAVGLTVEPANLADLIRLGREIKWALNDHPAAQHDDPRQSGIYGTILWESLDVEEPGLHQRNVTIFADGQVDRSPCGSGTSARLALLAEEGRISVGETLVHHSIVGSVFRAWIVDSKMVAGREMVVTEVEGSAHRTGRHEFILEEGDELGVGFQLR